MIKKSQNSSSKISDVLSDFGDYWLDMNTCPKALDEMTALDV